jgi:short-subunit dehydrogenase
MEMLMNSNSLQNKTALITGASSGLGADFARELARRGCSLILVARREDRLRAVQQEIQQDCPVQVEIQVLDLAEPNAAETLYRHTEGSGRAVDVLVNNAGFGLYGQHMNIPWENEQAMLHLDMLVPAHLTKLFLKDMLARNFGYVLMVSSIGGFQPSPTYASYSAAKSFILNLGEALNYELRKTGVGVTVVAPGVTATEFLKVSGQRTSLYQRLIMMKSSDVARIGIEAMLKRRPSIVPGRINALMVWSNRLVSRRTSAAVSEMLMETGQK